jgi:predicted acetyltransferase
MGQGEISDRPEIVLDVAGPNDVAVLSNLLELYLHDLSAAFGLELRADGRFGYEYLSRYWSEPGRRSPFLIRRGGRVVGFALIMRDSPACSNPEDFEVTEFFVLRRHRRSGVARQAAFILWNRFVAHWMVRVSEGNEDGLRFWGKVIPEYTGGLQKEATRPGRPSAWRVYTFDSRGPLSGITEAI